MPCTDYHDPADSYEQFRKRNNQLAQMLCGICQRVEKLDKEGNIASWSQILRLIERDPELSLWWENHKREDAKRLAKEREEKERKRARKAALAKLTPEERKLLGIKD